jgi:putative hydrolase of the HAD superfamily
MTGADSLEALVRGVELLCLDAGNTVVFLDHARVAESSAPLGFRTDAQSLARAEGATKLALERGEELDVAWSQSHRYAARGWGKTVGTMLARAGLPPARVPELLDALWPQHCEHNFWSRVPAGLVEALSLARQAGVRIAVVSNSEGMLESLFHRLGILGAMDLVVDSGIVGVEKPDPRIFRVALDHFGAAPERALHLGDNFSTDVLGARAAGIRVALVDPLGHMDGRHLDVPRVPGAVEVAQAVAAAPRGESRNRA